MLSGISTGCRGNAESTTAADRENECNCEYGGVYVCAESVNNADVSTSCVGTAGRRDSAVDVITSVESGGNREKVCSGICAWYGGNTGSDTAAAGWRGNAVDVITSPTGTDGAVGRIGIGVISSSTGGGRGGIHCAVNSLTSKDKDGRCMFCAVNASVSQNKNGGCVCDSDISAP